MNANFEEEPLINTVGGKKVLSYLEDLIVSNKFQKGIKKIREKHNIPINGFKFSNKEISEFQEDFLMFKVPSSFNGTRIEFFEINKDFQKFLKEVLEINNLNIKAVIKFYLFYNEFLSDFLNSDLELDIKNMCAIIDEKTIMKEVPEEYYYNYVKETIESYPIAIRIRPETTQNDITKQVKKLWPYIELLQEQYKKSDNLKNRRSRKEKIKTRNEFIYKNKNKSFNEIVSLVGKEFNEYLDVGLIGSIISTEKKKRN